MGRPGPPFVWGSSFISSSLSVSTISMWLLAAKEEMSEAGNGHGEQAAQHPSLHPLIGPQIGDVSPRPTFLTEWEVGDTCLRHGTARASLCRPDKLPVFLQRPRHIPEWLPAAISWHTCHHPHSLPYMPFQHPPPLLRITIIKRGWGNQELCHGC